MMSAAPHVFGEVEAKLVGITGVLSLTANPAQYPLTPNKATVIVLPFAEFGHVDLHRQSWSPDACLAMLLNNV